jgi:hypothetical protein
VKSAQAVKELVESIIELHARRIVAWSPDVSSEAEARARGRPYRYALVQRTVSASGSG